MKARYLICVSGFLLALSANAHAETVQRAFALSTQVWPQPNLSSTFIQIPVCWVNPSSADVAERAVVKDAVARTWEAASKVRFVDWDTCRPVNDGTIVRIKINDAQPHVKALGRAVMGHPEGMVLNFTFANWFSQCTGYNAETLEGANTIRKNCIANIAVHEFGHVLGFAHEQNRPDSPDWCNDAQGENGDVAIGDWDVRSVMNYCNLSFNPWKLGDAPARLSETDILAVQTFYKKPNENPVAVIEKDTYSTPVSQTIKFSATRSTDPEGNTLGYSWKFGDTSTIIATTSPYVSYNFKTEGRYAVFLTVSDGVNISGPAVTYVTVYNPAKVLIPILGLLLN